MKYQCDIEYEWLNQLSILLTSILTVKLFYLEN